MWSLPYCRTEPNRKRRTAPADGLDSVGKPRGQSGKVGEPFDQRDQRSLDRRVWRINKISDEEAVPRNHVTEPNVIRNIIIAQQHYHTPTKNDPKYKTPMATSNKDTNSKQLDIKRKNNENPINPNTKNNKKQTQQVIYIDCKQLNIY